LLPWIAVVVGLGVVGALTLFALRSPTLRDRRSSEAKADAFSEDGLREDLNETAVADRPLTDHIVSQKAAEDLRALLAADLVRVEGGTLPAGSKLSGTKVPDFLLSNHEVTLQEWREVLPYAKQNDYELTNEGRGKDPNGPVAWISWFDAVLWCNARSEQAGLMPVYQSGDGGVLKRQKTMPIMNPRANGYRLPTYAEWEWAATGGVRSRGFPYSGGEILHEVAWCPRNASRQVATACQKRPNELGLYDMTGNVREWCWSTLDEGPEPHNRLAAGGGVLFEHDDDHDVRSRNYARRTETTQHDLGLRLARNAPYDPSPVSVPVLLRE